MDCNCDACNGKDVEKFAKDCMKKYGWYAHYVLEDDCHINAHTHGVYQSYGHSDFQIVLPLDQKLAHTLFKELVEKVKKGEKFIANRRYAEVIKKYDVKFIMRKEGSRTVNRLILPDAQGNLEQDKMECPYNGQYDKF
jgi:hypothetical protein